MYKEKTFVVKIEKREERVTYQDKANARKK
jgi:hypothetical protein